MAIPSLSALLNHKVQVSLRSPGISIQPVLAGALWRIKFYNSVKCCSCHHHYTLIVSWVWLRTERTQYSHILFVIEKHSFFKFRGLKQNNKNVMCERERTQHLLGRNYSYVVEMLQEKLLIIISHAFSFTTKCLNAKLRYACRYTQKSCINSQL